LEVALCKKKGASQLKESLALKVFTLTDLFGMPLCALEISHSSRVYSNDDEGILLKKRGSLRERRFLLFWGGFEATRA
jgi:hypothetical protein